MGIVEKTKLELTSKTASLSNSPITISSSLAAASGANSTNNNNTYKVNGNKKASYSFSTENTNAENIDPSHQDEKDSSQIKYYHDNPAFESDSNPNNTSSCLTPDKVILNQIHSNHKEIHLNISSTSSSSSPRSKNPFQCNENTNTEISKLTSTFDPKEIIQLNNSKSSSTGTYAIASSTTLLYITSPNSVQSQISSPRSNKIKEEPGATSLTSYNTAEKLAAAAAAAVSSSANSVVEIPNFGEELTSMMKQNRMDEIEISSCKKFDSKINQSHGFTFGEANTATKNYTKAGCNNNLSSGSTSISDDDANLKLTASSSYDIKVRRRRACQLKVLIVFLAMVTAGCIGCIFSYYFMRYKVENQRYLNYTQFMVNERSSKIGSNKLEIIVPFNSSIADLNDKSAIVNKIQEIVLQTFVDMNKTVEVIQLYELNEYSNNSYLASIDVELKDASAFSIVTLLEETDGRVKLADHCEILNIYREIFKNLTLALNINIDSLRIDFSNIQILFDLKPTSVKTPDSRLFTDSTTLISTTVTSTQTNIPAENVNLALDLNLYRLAPTIKIYESTSILTEISKKMSSTLQSTTNTVLSTTTAPESTTLFSPTSTTSTSSTTSSTSSTTTSTSSTTTSTSSTTTSISSTTTSTSSTTTSTSSTRTVPTSTQSSTESTTVQVLTTTVPEIIVLTEDSTSSLTKTTVLQTTSTEISTTTTTEISNTFRLFSSTERTMIELTDPLAEITSTELPESSSSSTQVNIGLKAEEEENFNSLKNDDLKKQFQQKQLDLNRLLNVKRIRPTFNTQKTSETNNLDNTGIKEVSQNLDVENSNSNTEFIVDLVLDNESAKKIDLQSNNRESFVSESSTTLPKSTPGLEFDETSKQSQSIEKAENLQSHDLNHNDLDVLLQIDTRNDLVLSRLFKNTNRK